jgi:hypothetical protein
MVSTFACKFSTCNRYAGERLEVGGNLGLTGRGAATVAALFHAAPNMVGLSVCPQCTRYTS